MKVSQEMSKRKELQSHDIRFEKRSREFVSVVRIIDSNQESKAKAISSQLARVRSKV